MPSWWDHTDEEIVDVQGDYTQPWGVPSKARTAKDNDVVWSWPADYPEEYRRSSCSAKLRWSLKYREEILETQICKERMGAFNTLCNGCNLYFKSCMFTKEQLKNRNDEGKYNRACRWCRTDIGKETDWNEFEFEDHIHCNLPGVNRCRESTVLTPPEWLDLDPETRAWRRKRLPVWESNSKAKTLPAAPVVHSKTPMRKGRNEEKTLARIARDNASRKESREALNSKPNRRLFRFGKD